MSGKCVRKKICDFLTYKICGIAALAFCIGALCGLFMPIGFIAFLEAVILICLAYLCLFQW